MGKQCAYTALCTEVVPEGSSRCEKHKEMTRQRTRERDAFLKAAGLCVRCGDSHDRGTLKCASCSEVDNRQHKELRRAQNVLLSLHPEKKKKKKDNNDNDSDKQKDPVTESKRDRESERRRMRRQERKEAGLCRDCSNPRVRGLTSCAACAAKRNRGCKKAIVRRKEMLTEAAAMLLELEPDILDDKSRAEKKTKKKETGRSPRERLSRVTLPGPDASYLADAESVLATGEVSVSTRRPDYRPQREVPRPDWRHYGY
ncbi:hypothetical protein F5Y14DRAFT_437292 [Nemania sp. NC0429]|nr:hypothetical protein F5Y14DRAFT_437292 [Nemania sp. NC0429]